MTFVTFRALSPRALPPRSVLPKSAARVPRLPRTLPRPRGTEARAAGSPFMRLVSLLSLSVALLAAAPLAAETRPLPPRPGEGIPDYVSRLSSLEQRIQSGSGRTLNDARRTGARANIDGLRRLLDRYRADNVLTADERRDLNQQFQAVGSSISRNR